MNRRGFLRMIGLCGAAPAAGAAALIPSSVAGGGAAKEITFVLSIDAPLREILAYESAYLERYGRMVTKYAIRSRGGLVSVADGKMTFAKV